MAYDYTDPRTAPLEMTSDQFRALGHTLIDQIADFLASLPDRPVTPGETPAQVRALLGDQRLANQPTSPDQMLNEVATLLFDHSTFNGHPRFWGYITASAAPIGALADLLAAAVNPNVGAWELSPLASEIETQTIGWIADLIGYPATCGGLLVSGGNMANFTGFWAARQAKAPWNVREHGLRSGPGQLRAYVSAETHTWIQKAADLSGLGTAAIRWIATGDDLRIDLDALRAQIEHDQAQGDIPFLVVGTGGSVSTGVVDPLPELAAICREYGLWFHVDGAYGAPAAALPTAPAELLGLREADSVALDPHKWLYSALEAGCVLVKDPQALPDTFNYHPEYYRFDSPEEAPGVNYLEHGPQNSRGFRALKVWLGLRQAGREGYVRMITDDIALAQAFEQLVHDHGELDAVTQGLSIVTFRYVPVDLNRAAAGAEDYLNALNEALLTQLQTGGEVYLSNAVIRGQFLLRLCIVNFRTTLADIRMLPEIVVRVGRALDATMRPTSLQ
jgi:aromatic-L-amino-acid/L-tryptophan decarboxylase